MQNRLDSLFKAYSVAQSPFKWFLSSTFCGTAYLKKVNSNDSKHKQTQECDDDYVDHSF